MGDIEDPRILAIMAKLNTDGTNQSEPTKEEKPKEIKPPESFDDFLKLEKLAEWPQRITSESILDLGEQRELLGSENDILAKLEEATPLDMEHLQNLENRLSKFSETLSRLAKKFAFRDVTNLAEKIDRELPDESPAVKELEKVFLTETDRAEGAEGDSTKDQSNKGHFRESAEENESKQVEHCSYPGYSPLERSQLPGVLEAPQILHRVAKAQHFNAGLKRFWKKIFLSEASVALMEDGFWWIFIQLFEAKRQNEQYQLFNRMADTFVALFTSINPEVKDKFFSVYSDCLAQSIYTAFREAFPESAKLFQDNFKQNIVNLTSEWISGVHPNPGSWNSWNVKILDPKSPNSGSSRLKMAKLKSVEQALSSNASYKLKMEEFNQVLAQLDRVPAGPSRQVTQQSRRSQHVLSLTPAAVTSSTPLPAIGQARKPSSHDLPSKFHADLVRPEVVSKATVASSQATKVVKKRPQLMPSHPIGPGPEMIRVMFDLKGRSPLVAHYLHMHQVRDINRHGADRQFVRRTEIIGSESENPTYKEVIKKSLETSVVLNMEYQRICEETNNEINKIERKTRETNRQIDKLKKELMFSKNSYEIKALSERLLSKNDYSDHQRADSRNQQEPLDLLYDL